MTTHFLRDPSPAIPTIRELFERLGYTEGTDFEIRPSRIPGAVVLSDCWQSSGLYDMAQVLDALQFIEADEDIDIWDVLSPACLDPDAHDYYDAEPGEPK